MNRFYIFVILCILTSCSQFPAITNYEYTKIHCGFGPEDMILDTLSNNNRILISCASRRLAYGDYGEIQCLDLKSDSISTLIRSNEPKNFLFHPHGIFLRIVHNKKYLYVINHNDDNEHHAIIRYLCKDDHLFYINQFHHNLLNSPNALFVFKDGSFLVGNDAGVRSNTMEKILRQKKSNIVFFNGKNNWEVVADNLGMITGINAINQKIYASAALENKIYSFDLIGNKLLDKNVVANINGGDNIRIFDDYLITSSHYKPMKFIKHVKNIKYSTPSIIYLINPDKKASKALYVNKGDQINAASTGIIYQNKLYISQIFEPYILKVNLSDLDFNEMIWEQ